ncbi:aminotransferase class I/II-fold pyridoxal phosphate-dependent enzyme, partial [Mesorhizobium sp. M4B.F.Ca.ET.089.01.1.1]|uniref:aminotransferase class I/II-fold pyridoxal phosphate-dependent enzyme n=1 Tax=Mesorhizobium sp. M4B.F.Ca.ET.089.01.1.1 TaxID=2496662 RepID=UPI000FE2A905
VCGPAGRGLAHDLEGRDNVVVLHTCGKALGASGALVTAPAVICDYLVNRCRPFVYATAPSPLMAVAAATALDIVVQEPERRERLASLVALAGKRAEELGLPTSGSQILPVVVGDNGRAMALAAALQSHGFDVRGIRPPTVPEGTARLRISLTLNVGEADVSALFDALAAEWERAR